MKLDEIAVLTTLKEFSLYGGVPRQCPHIFLGWFWLEAWIWRVHSLRLPQDMLASRTLVRSEAGDTGAGVGAKCGLGLLPGSVAITAYVSPRICWHLARWWEVQLEIEGLVSEPSAAWGFSQAQWPCCCNLGVVRSQVAGSEPLRCGSKLISLPLRLCSLPTGNGCLPRRGSVLEQVETEWAPCVGWSIHRDGPRKTEFQAAPHLSSLWVQQWEPLAQ